MFDQSVSQRPLASHETVLQFGQGKRFEYNKELTVSAMIEQQVVKQPDKVAVIFQRQHLTYQQLNERANQLAHWLIRKGIKTGTNVAIYLEPCLELAVSILAVLKAGGCYVPLDINYPIERLNYMLADSSAVLLLTQSALAHSLNDATIELLELDKQASLLKKEAISNPNVAITADDFAYMIYTSGSTGKPKGIAIHHRAINNHMSWMQHQFDFNATDIVLLKTPVSFDPSVWEFFIPLYAGAQLVIAPTGAYLNPGTLIKLINHYQITTLQFVPSLLHEFLKYKKRNQCHSLQRVFVGGEALGVETKRAFFSKMSCSLFNLYGPTEATIEVASHPIIDIPDDIHTNIIGKPIYNTELYVLNHEMNLANIDEEGELYIGGDGLAKGYFNNDILTEEKFIKSPFQNCCYETLYKTGDIVKWQASGDLVYIGRNNEQIKIHGVRIEPDEIVSHILNNHPVTQCVVAKKTDQNHHAYLACYLIPQEEQTLELSAIKASLKQFFPRFMVPKRFMIIAALPLTVNGKIDYTALPDPEHAVQSESLNEEQGTQEEEQVLRIWRKLLGNQRIQRQDNYFDAGGNSLLAFELLTAIKAALNVSLQVKDIFLYPTIAELTSHIIALKQKRAKKKNQKASIDSLIPLQTKGDQVPLFLIHPIGGTVFWYTILAHALGDTRPVYGIQDPTLDLEKPIFNSIHEMADFYISLIQRVQPHGPYFIGGASFGATVAIEIARKLEACHEEIALIPIFDGWAVYPNTLRDDNYFKESMRRQHAEIEAKFAEHNLPKPDDLFVMQWHRLGLLWSYTLDEIKSPIVLFKAQEILPAFKEVDAPFNHWENYSKQPFQTYTVPGDHETMFEMPHVNELADLLRKCLDEI